MIEEEPRPDRKEVSDHEKIDLVNNQVMYIFGE